MASIKKKYSFTNKRNIWRLIPSESGYLVIEERDLNTREVFFNCLKTEDGKVLFKNFQLDEKYWVGIEAIYDGIIFFYKFRKPDMPGHKGIYAFDISKEKIIWQNDDLIYLLAKENRIYAYQTIFDGRLYFVLNALTGEIVDELGGEFKEINKLREETMGNDFVNSFLIPQKFESGNNDDDGNIFQQLISDKKIIGEVNWIKSAGLVFYNYHLKNSNGMLNNYFEIFDTEKRKILLKEEANTNLKNLVFESFFLIKDLLFLLIEKQKLVVYRIKQ